MKTIFSTHTLRLFHLVSLCLLFASLAWVSTARAESEAEVQELISKATQGDAGAQNNLGVCYFNGDGVEKNYTRAFYWYEKSANQNLPVAQYNLGLLYYYGVGVEEDNQKALSWFKKSAIQDYADAEYMLGRMYLLEHRGITRNLNSAALYHYFAKKHGSQRLRWAQENESVEVMRSWRGCLSAKHEKDANEWSRKAAAKGGVTYGRLTLAEIKSGFNALVRQAHESAINASGAVVEGNNLKAFVEGAKIGRQMMSWDQLFAEYDYLWPDLTVDECNDFASFYAVVEQERNKAVENGAVLTGAGLFLKALFGD